MTDDNNEKPVLSLGDTFEVIEDAPAPAAAPAAAAAAPKPAAAPAPGANPNDPPFGPIRSANAWGSMGLVIAIAGLLGPWADQGGNLAHGLLLSVSIWFLVRGGFLAVQRTGMTLPIGLPVTLLAYGVLRIAMGGEVAALGWNESAGVLDVAGALLTVLGALLAILMPRTVAKKKDAKLPPAGAPLQLDKQFSRSLLAYLMIFIGLQMNWTEQEAGADSLMGVITLLLAMLMVWACWVAMWQLWQRELVTKKLGILLFVAPLEAFFMGILGVARVGLAGNLPENFTILENAYPSDLDSLPFLAYGGGPLLVTLASGYALVLLSSGAKQAQALVKERKAAEVEARKAARANKKGGAPASDKKPAAAKKAASGEKVESKKK